MKRVFLIAIILTVCIVVRPARSFADFIWREVGQGITERDFQTILVDTTHANILYVGAEKSVYQSKDAGRNWKRLLRVPGEGLGVHFLAMDPQNPKIIFAATEGGLYRTLDGGESWEKPFRGIGEFSRRALCVLLDVADSHRVYLGTGEGFFMSKDGGSHFERDAGRLNQLPIVYLLQEPVDPNKLFAATAEGLFRSMDRGESWERVFVTATDGEALEGGDPVGENGEKLIVSQEQVTSIAFSPKNSRQIFLGTAKGLYESQDEGQNWERFSKIGLTSSNIRHLVFQDQALFTATDEGIYHYSEEEKNWQRLRTGLSSERARFLAAAPYGGARFPVNVKLSGRKFANFNLDVGVGDAAVRAGILGECSGCHNGERKCKVQKSHESLSVGVRCKTTV